MIASTGGFKVTMDNSKQKQFNGVWWKTGSKDRLPWSGKRSTTANETRHFFGDVAIDGMLQPSAIKASGVVSAVGLASATITAPKGHDALPYLLSGISCRWHHTKFDDKCGQKTKDKTGVESWGGYSNI